jgi:hypothetical protein
MIINNAFKSPFTGTTDYFDAHGLKNLEKANVDEIWYWYYNGGYDGQGQMLVRIGDLYWLHDMNHCSCYGPLEKLNSTLMGEGKSLDVLYDCLSDDLKRQTWELFYTNGIKVEKQHVMIHIPKPVNDNSSGLYILSNSKEEIEKEPVDLESYLINNLVSG